MRPTVLITAGPTRERLDPVRFISNYSTGTFGYEIARAAKSKGVRTILVSGSTCLKAPKGVKFIAVESAKDMRAAVLREFKNASIIIMAAAVADWEAKNIAVKKIKKSDMYMTLRLKKTPDILEELGKKAKGKTLVGFALETEALKKGALKKLQEKKIDIIVANRLNKKRNIFGNNNTEVMIIDRFGREAILRNRSKKVIAKIILDKALNFKI